MVALFLFVKKPVGKKLILKIISPIPVISNLLKQIDVARFCRIFSTLVASAVPISDALDISLSSLSHPQFTSVHKNIVDRIVQGSTIAQAFSDNAVFPALLIQMINAGEKSGTMDTALADLATFYEEEVEEAVKKTTQLLEPAVMLMVGIGVGGIILSIIGPLYSVVGNLQTSVTK
jgi:type IV pilus assembly protein PilC